jgi:hypothetical protein
MAANNRYRLRFPFWLDLKKPEEEALADTIEHLKSDRRFAATVRDGIRLIVDLRAGQLDVLFELFPWIKDKLAVVQSPPVPTTAIEAQLKRLEAMLKEQGAVPIKRPMTVTGPQPLGVSKVSAPTFDDDDHNILVSRRNTSTDVSLNIMNSMFGLQQKTPDVRGSLEESMS